MSGIGGILNLDGSAVSPGLLEHIASSIKKRGPDGIRIWNAKNIGIVHSHFWTTPEDTGEEQPISDGFLTLAADARIDNRNELIPLLKDFIAREVPSDAEIILAAYQKWNEECPKYLIGDFAFAIWDAERECLFLARDPVGIRLLHYLRTGNSFVFGSSVGSVLATINTVPEPNIPLVADLLAGRYDRWIDETAFKDIHRLPPAHSMTVHPSGIRLTRYWAFGARKESPLATEEEYIARFGELFREAVRCRMRVTDSLAMTVSGGIDSSSIACMAHHLISSGDVCTTGRMYSAVFEDTPSADEKAYLDELIAACPRFPVTEIPSDTLWGLCEFADDAGYPLDDPEIEATRAVMLTQLSHIAHDGHRVVLSGHGGDQVMYTDAYDIPTSLNDIALTMLPSEFRHFLRNGIPVPKLLEEAYIIPLIPVVLRRRLSRLLRDPTIGGLLTPRCFNIPPPDHADSSHKFRTETSSEIYLAVTEGLNSVYRVTQDTYASYTGIDWRFPFYDRRLIDFLLSVPPSYMFRGGFSRCLIRQYMKGLLPEKIRRRTTKCHLGDIQERGIQEKERRRIQELINDSRAVEMGLVNPDALKKAWESCWNGGEYPARPLVRFLCAEAWLRYYGRKYRLPRRADAGIPGPE